MHCCFSISYNAKAYAFMVQLHNTALTLIKQVVDDCSESAYLNLFQATSRWERSRSTHDLVQYTWKDPYCIRTVIRNNETRGRSTIRFETRILHV